MNNDAPGRPSHRTALVFTATVTTFGAVLGAAMCTQKSVKENRFEKISEAEYAKHPDDPIAGARASADALQREFKSTTAPESQRKLAAAAFVGFYAKNVYSIPAVCAESGVQLTSYPAHFSELHALPLQVAGRYVDVAETIAYIRASGLEPARRELARIVAMDKSDLPTVCAFMQEKGREVANGATFSIAAPEIYSILMNGVAVE